MQDDIMVTKDRNMMEVSTCEQALAARFMEEEDQDIPEELDMESFLETEQKPGKHRKGSVLLKYVCCDSRRGDLS